MKKQIGYIERLLIAECKKDEPSFMQVNRLFELGADPNAVNEYGENVISANMTFVKNSEEHFEMLLEEIVETLGEESISVETVERQQ